MREASPAFITTLLVSAALVLNPVARTGLLAVLTAPLTLVRAGARILINLPRLPSLLSENAELRRRLMARQLEHAQLAESVRARREAQTLLALSPNRPGIIAGVIGRSILPTQHTVLLNRGSTHGLTLDSVIVDEEGVIGRVVELHPGTCLVMLLTDPDSRVAGLVERSRESGLLVGEAAGRSSFMYLEADADIKEGDRIVTAELGGPFPKGLLLGTVSRITRDELSGSASATVIPAASLSRLEEVLCLPSASK